MTSTGTAPRPKPSPAALGGPRPRTVLALGLTEEEAHRLRRIEDAHRFHYVTLGDFERVDNPEKCRPAEVVAEIVAAARRHASPIAGVIAFDDYPASLLATAIARELGLPGPSPEAALLCHHKLWSRVVQREAVPQAVPRFQPVDPARAYRPADLELAFPFWLKPVKASLSFLGFRVNSMPEFERALAAARSRLGAHTRAFNDFLALIRPEAPAGLAHVGGDWLIAEELLKGRQCTLEGFLKGGRLTVLGVVDSIRHGRCPSFKRFDYPSGLPRRVQREMARLAGAVMARVGFDDGIFDVEFFYDPRRGHPAIIEINPRFCVQFSDLYEKVDGVSSHQVLVELATGLHPRFVPGQGRHRVAAGFVLRQFADRRVTRAPTAADVARLGERLPDAVVQLCAGEGDRLSDLAQDSYSFRYALINLGAADRRRLHADFRLARSLLPYEFAPVTASP